MRGFVAILILAVVCYGLYLMAGSDASVMFPATNPASLDAAAAARKAEAAALESQAQNVRDEIYRQTQTVLDANLRETYAVQATATAEIVQVTIAAAMAQDTATAQVVGTDQANRQAQMVITQTADAIALAAMSVRATDIARESQNAAQWEAMRLDAAVGTRFLWANWPLWLFGLVFSASVSGGGYYLYKSLRIKQSTAVGVIPMDARGNSYAAVINGRVHNPNIMVSQSLDPRAPIPQTAMSIQNDIARLRQGVQAIGSLERGGYRKDSYTAANGLVDQIAATQQAMLPEVAPWDLTGWTGKTLPIGISEGGAGVEISPDRCPNLIFAGTSNAGKTMRGTRPLIAEALAARWQVIAMSEKMADFSIFGSHPNLIRIDGEAPELLNVLRGVLSEVTRRNEILKETGQTTYYRLTNAETYIGPRIMVVVDGLVSFIYGAGNKAIGEQIWKASVNIASKCRALGIMMVFAATDPSHRLGDSWMALRGNCGRVVFKLLDAGASRIVLDTVGAESLPVGQFIARLDGDPVRGVAFYPQDTDITNFMLSHPVAALPAPAFLGEKTIPIISTPVDVQTDVITQDERIRQMAGEGISMNEIQLRVFGRVGGSAFYAVKRALNGSTGSTTTLFPENEPFAAD